jgi:integrase
MMSKKTVTLHNLAALGAERLAEILVDLAEADAEVKRRLRLELAAQVGGDSIAAEIGKRITALRKARSLVDWQKRRDFVKDLDLQRAMIVDRVAQTRADLALDLMWRFGCHTFRATGITAYLANGGALEHAQEMAAHESPRTTKLYDRTKERLTQDEVERIRL